MLTRIEVLNYRALHYVNQTLEPFQVLIGPNASGKSTFLDVIAFLGDMLTKPSVADAIRERAPDFHDLTWMQSSDWAEFVVEAKIPDRLLRSTSHTHVRYEIRVGIDEETTELTVLTETLWLMSNGKHIEDEQLRLFPDVRQLPTSGRITHEFKKHTPPGWRKVLNKTETGNDSFQAETTSWKNLFRFAPKRPALANLPEDETRFPVAIWFKRYISEGIQRIVLNSESLRRPSPPQSPRNFLPDGSNLPWVVYELEQKHPGSLKKWIKHIQTALPDIKSISTNERDEDRHRYLIVKYDTGLVAPSWSISDGTLRMLALTILAYLPQIEGLYLIEEPENGIYPRAVETVYQSLKSVYTAQVLLATHSPVILSLTEPKQLLCFARTEWGETAIVRGDLHPRLADWKGEVNLSMLFASGVLG